MVKVIGHFIGGKHVKGNSGRFADVFNPNTGEVSAKVALASQAELRAAVENAKQAQTGCSHITNSISRSPGYWKSLDHPGSHRIRSYRSTTFRLTVSGR